MPRALSKREAAFLADQRIDARWIHVRPAGQTLHEAVAEMRLQDRYVVHGFSPCDCGLALRNRKGNCLNCYRKQLEHVFRYIEPGFVYILCSWTAELIKIGSTEGTPETRADQLNTKGYAAARDWYVCDFVRVRRRGLLEDQLKEILRDYNVEVPYAFGGKETYSRETYNCPVAHAQRTMRRLNRDYIRRHHLKTGLRSRSPPKAAIA